VVVIAFEEGKQIVKGLIEAGYGPGKVGMYGADGLRSEELPKLVDPNNPSVLAGMKGTAPASGEARVPAHRSGGAHGRPDRRRRVQADMV
jgi:hypothetical protein